MQISDKREVRKYLDEDLKVIDSNYDVLQPIPNEYYHRRVETDVDGIFSV